MSYYFILSVDFVSIVTIEKAASCKCRFGGRKSQSVGKHQSLVEEPTSVRCGGMVLFTQAKYPIGYVLAAFSSSSSLH